MKKIQEDKLSALLDMLPTSVKRAFMSNTEKAKDIDMTNARDAYYDLPKHIRAKIDAMIDRDTGRVKAGANSEELDESLVSKINDEGYKQWKYKEHLAYGKDENGAKYYLQLKAKLDPNLASKLRNIDTSEIEATGLGVGYVDPYLKAIYKNEVDTLEKKELPLFITENKNKIKMNKKDLMEMIREVIAEETNQTTMGLDNQGTVAYITSKQRDDLLKLGSVSVDDLTDLRISFRPERNDIKFDDSIMYNVRDGSGPNPGVQLLSTGLKKRPKVTENKTKMKVNQLKQIIREEIAKVLNEQTNRVGWDKGYSVGIEFNEELAQLLAPYLERGTITKDELEMAADQAGSQDYAEWDRIIGSKSEGPYTIKMFNGNIQISGTKGKNISKNMQSSFDKYGTNLGGK